MSGFKPELLIGSAITEITFGGFYITFVGYGGELAGGRLRWHLRVSSDVWMKLSTEVNGAERSNPVKLAEGLISLIDKPINKSDINEEGMETVFDLQSLVIEKSSSGMSGIGDLEVWVTSNKSPDRLEGLWEL